MPASRAPSDPLFAHAWVHVFEEDSAEGEVYRPEDDDIPLSRRPRERIELLADGSATVSRPGADDRPAAQPATWKVEEGAVVIRAHAGTERFRVVRQTPFRLLIRSGGDES